MHVVNTIFYRSVSRQSPVVNSLMAELAENTMIESSTNKRKSLSKAPEQNKTQVPVVAFCVTPTSSIDNDKGAFEVRKRKVPGARRKQPACPIAFDYNSLFDVGK